MSPFVLDNVVAEGVVATASAADPPWENPEGGRGWGATLDGADDVGGVLPRSESFLDCLRCKMRMRMRIIPAVMIGYICAVARTLLT